MSVATERNREIVQEGLNKRKSTKREQEQKHEAVQLEMFAMVNANHDAASKRREQEEALAAQEEALAAQKAVRAARSKYMDELLTARNIGLLRVFGYLVLGAISSILFVTELLPFYVETAIMAIALYAAVQEFVRSVKRTAALAAFDEMEA